MKKTDNVVEKKRIEKKFLVPNAITICNLFLGYLSIIMTFEGNYILACWLIVIAMIADTLDGKTARKLNAFSEFGKELDSFCDAISFGLAPAVLVYRILKEFYPVKEIALAISFIFALCGVLRLVKFNIITEASDSKADFSGMPIPNAAGLIVSYYIFSYNILGEFKFVNIFFGLVVASALLMVSTITFKLPGKIFFFIPKKLNLPIFIFLLVFLKYSMFPVLIIYSFINLFYAVRKRALEFR
jgi:CDP-diacylglycerol--serine O-phosphatidyltransferase